MIRRLIWTAAVALVVLGLAGTDWGGGEIWARSRWSTPTVVWVRAAGTSYSYALMGGP
jgi:hypothetical protein